MRPLIPQSQTTFDGAGIVYQFVVGDNGVATALDEIHISGPERFPKQPYAAEDHRGRPDPRGVSRTRLCPGASDRHGRRVPARAGEVPCLRASKDESVQSATHGGWTSRSERILGAGVHVSGHRGTQGRSWHSGRTQPRDRYAGPQNPVPTAALELRKTMADRFISPLASCFPPGVPRHALAPASHQILQTPGYVVHLLEYRTRTGSFPRTPDRMCQALSRSGRATRADAGRAIRWSAGFSTQALPIARARRRCGRRSASGSSTARCGR